MDEVKETTLRKGFMDAVARYNRTAAAGTWMEAWLAAADAAEAARQLEAFWNHQALEWGNRNMEAVPDDV